MTNKQKITTSSQFHFQVLNKDKTKITGEHKSSNSQGLKRTLKTKNEEMLGMTKGFTSLNQKRMRQNLTKKDESSRTERIFNRLKSTNELLQAQNERLLLENTQLKEEITNFKNMIDSSSDDALRINTTLHSLQLGPNMYESIFSYPVDTPQVKIDPLVWNIFYASVSSDYAIPDPTFVETLSTNVSR